MKRNTIINISLIILICLTVIISVVVGLNRQNGNRNQTETPSGSETVALQDETSSNFESETESMTVFIPEPVTPENITFTTDEDTYNYAVSQINERKYYSAIKYLRQIPTYKDAKTLMAESYRHIQGEYFTYSSTWARAIACPEMNTATISSDYVLNRSDASLANGQIVQCLSEGFIDETGTFHLLTPWNSKDVYEPLLNYNKSTKFRMITGIDENSWLILTKNGGLVKYSYNYDTTESTLTSYNTDSLSPNENIIYISRKEILTDLGYIYVVTDNKLTKNPLLKDIVTTNNGLYLYENGTVSYCYEDVFPIIKSWSDIICIDANITSIYSFLSYCCALTSDGTILVAVEDSTTTMKPFPSDKTFISVTCNGSDTIAALTDSGDIYFYDMSKHLRRYNSSNSSTEEETLGNIPDNSPTISFTSDDAIYLYAFQQMNAKKYHTAIKYLRMIPNYKDSAKLQGKIYKNIHNDRFAESYDNGVRKIIACEGMNDKTLSSYNVVNIMNKVNFTGTVIQNFSWGFLDSSGNLYVTETYTSDGLRKKYDCLLQQNKKTKFLQISDYDLLLTTDNKVLCQGSQYDSDPFTDTDDFVTLKSDILAQNEKIVYISGGYAMSNTGNVYRCNTFNYRLEKMDSLKNVISVTGDLYLTTAGTVVSKSSKKYTAVNSWTDITSIERVSYGYVGLKSDGTIVSANEEGGNKDHIFPTDVRFISITSMGGSGIAALSHTGDLYIFAL